MSTPNKTYNVSNDSIVCNLFYNAAVLAVFLTAIAF